MVSSENVSDLHRLNSLLDIFFLLGILLRNSVVAPLEVVSLVYSFSKNIFYRFENVLRTARIFWFVSSVNVTQILFDFAYSVFQVI